MHYLGLGAVVGSRVVRLLVKGGHVAVVGVELHRGGRDRGGLCHRCRAVPVSAVIGTAVVRSAVRDTRQSNSVSLGKGSVGGVNGAVASQVRLAVAAGGDVVGRVVAREVAVLRRGAGGRVGEGHSVSGVGLLGGINGAVAQQVVGATAV